MEKKSNKIYILITIGIIGAIMLTLGITYAYWRITKEQTNENMVTTACLDFEITNEQDYIQLKNAFPISDYEGYELMPYKFTIKNKCEDNATYQINLEMLEGSDMSTNYVKYVLNEPIEKYALEGEGNFNESYDTLEECQDNKEWREEDGSLITKDCEFEGNKYVLEYIVYIKFNSFYTYESCQVALDYEISEGFTITKECEKVKVDPYYYDAYDNIKILGEEDDEEGYVLNNAIEGKKLTSGILEPEESKDFTLRLWIDEDVKLEDGIMNKKLLSKITVSSTYLR